MQTPSQMSLWKAAASTLAGALFLLFGGAATAQTVDQTSRSNLLSQFSDSLDALTARVSPAVVQVQVTGFGALGGDKGQGEAAIIGRQRALGSGVIVDPSGYIITNAHVVKGAQRVRVLLTPPAPGESQVGATLGLTDHIPPMDAKIVGVADTADIALLKVDGQNLPTLPFADYTNLKKGEIVLAFGNPEGLENSVTMGVVSAVARQANPATPLIYIQTDAPINPGNSGGPLVNTRGEVVGINTFILSVSGGSQGLGFAIPSSVVHFVYEQLRKYGHTHRSVIGAEMQEITPDLAAGLNLARQEGVIISDVLPGGPADKAGLHVQDILLSLDGRAIGSVPLAAMIISTRPADAVVDAEVLRGTQRASLHIPVIQQRNEVDESLDLADPSKSLVPRLGIFGVEITDKLAQEISDLRIPSGVIVAAMAANLLEVQIDLQPGDVIHALNGQKVETLDGLRAALNAMEPGAPGVLQIERDSKLMYLTFETE
ncbi:MAG TPA: trypsin-like peptidase domain-containing protein [Candidatus Acidoferrum sp.]|nr:trypsin-like peptidase domain-containing protein [Candidatus Acidoferrum sp.]